MTEYKIKILKAIGSGCLSLCDYLVKKEEMTKEDALAYIEANNTPQE